MTTLLYTHSACLAHEPGRNHPESPARLRAILDALSAPAFSPLVRRDAPLAETAHLVRVHDAEFVDQVIATIPKTGRAYLDADTAVSPGSREAALRAAGALVAAVDAIMAGEGDNAFCAVRPPGHHAEPRRAMGFCLFNNVAIGALHARSAHQLNRPAVIDFDVHHGNGTQARFAADPDLFFASTHQWPLYPGTGGPDEHGVGNIFNLTLAPGSGSDSFREAMTHHIIPALDAFAPDIILISAGFDAHAEDPLANLRFVESDYAWVTSELVEMARRHCQGRIVSTLEGGYNLDALTRSVEAHVTSLMAA